MSADIPEKGMEEATPRPYGRRVTKSSARTMTTRQTVYTATTAVAVLAFAGSGLANLLHVEHIARDMAHLGYPSYFMTILGTWKLLGVIVVGAPQLPRAKEWAYAGMIFDLTGAAASRAASGDSAIMVLVPLFIAVAVTLSWSSRPASRKLPTPSLQSGG